MMSDIEIRSIERGYMTIQAPLSKNSNFDKLNKLPGFKKWQGRLLKFRPVASNLNYIHEQWPEANWIDDAEEIIINHLKDINLALETNAKKQQILEDDGSYEYKTIPYEHQRQCFLLSRDLPWFALLFEMGGGKTKVTLDTVAYLYSKGKIETFIIIAPKGVHRNWIDEQIPEHFPDWCPHNADFYSSKHGKKRINEINSILLDKKKLSIIAFNIESFTSIKAKKMLELIIDTKKCFVAIDESSTIKSTQAKRTNYLIKTCKDVIYKRILNGTPIEKGIEDYYTQFKFLSDNIIGYDTYTTFKAQYCNEVKVPVDPTDPNSKTYSKIVGYHNVNELIEKVKPWSMRIRKKECTDLPEKIYKLWPIEITSEQSKAYNELKENYITQIEKHAIEEELPIVRLLRLQQIICGWYPSEDNKKMLPIPGGNPRLDALKEICQEVENNNDKAIIWARFKCDIYAIENLLKGKCVSYHGDVNEETRIENVKRFRHDPEIKFMIAIFSSNSGAVRGHNWTCASVCIYYSNIFDLGARLQSEDRIHRIGMGDKALYIDLMAIGTIDKKIINAFKNKKNIADLVTGDGPSGFLNFIKND